MILGTPRILRVLVHGHVCLPFRDGFMLVEGIRMAQYYDDYCRLILGCVTDLA